jgi:hypothetical protein
VLGFPRKLLQRRVVVRGMNTDRKHELKFDIPVAFILALAAFGYEQFNLPHSKTVGFVALAICLVLLARIIQITWIILTRTNITFKDTSEFTWWRRQVIAHDIEGMHKYFTSLEIPVPDPIPPLTVHEENRAISKGQHSYRSELKIPRPQIANRKVVTDIYAAYVILEAFPDPAKSESFFESLPGNEANVLQLHQLMFFSVELRYYFRASYWDSMEAEAPPAALVLWKIRDALGKAFADRLASKVFHVVIDSLPEISDPDMNVLFTKALKIADTIVEAYQQNWPTIQKILDDNPLTGARLTLRRAQT